MVREHQLRVSAVSVSVTVRAGGGVNVRHRVLLDSRPFFARRYVEQVGASELECTLQSECAVGV